MKRCTLCVARQLPCSRRTYGPEKERARENRYALFDRAPPIIRPDEPLLTMTEEEARWGAMGTALAMGFRFPGMSPDSIVSFTNDAVAFSADDYVPLQRLYVEME